MPKINIPVCSLYFALSVLQNFTSNSLNVFSSYQKKKKRCISMEDLSVRLCALLLFSNSHCHYPLRWHLDNDPSPSEVLLFYCSRKRGQKQIPGLHMGKHWGCPNPSFSPALLWGSSQLLPTTRYGCTPRHCLPSSATASGPSAFFLATK